MANQKLKSHYIMQWMQDVDRKRSRDQVTTAPEVTPDQGARPLTRPESPVVVNLDSDEEEVKRPRLTMPSPPPNAIEELLDEVARREQADQLLDVVDIADLPSNFKLEDYVHPFAVSPDFDLDEIVSSIPTSPFNPHSFTVVLFIR